MKKLQILCLGAALATASTNANGQTEGTVYNDAKDCRGIEQNSTRLACYDSVTDGITFTVEVREKAEREAFGKSSISTKNDSKAKDIRNEVSEVSVKIASVTKLKTGKHIFITDDGQIWRQISADYVAKEKTPYKATIKQGRLGSYSLVSKKYPKVIKVKRAK